MSLEHLPSAIVTATLQLRLARLVRRRHLRPLIRTNLRTAALAAGALILAAGPATSSPPAPPSSPVIALITKGNLT